MEPKSSSSPAGVVTANDGHVHGDVLLAVAEGNAESQPDEAVLAHIFSCDQCGENVRAIRASLAGLGIKAGRPKPATPAAPTMPAAPQLPKGGAVDAQAVLASMATPESDDSTDRSKSMVWKVVLVGAVLAGAMYFLRNFATGLH